MLLSRSRNMRGNGRVDEDLDEYEDECGDEYGDVGADEYEDDEEEEEEEEVQEDEPLSEEAMKYLDLRQRLKERMRSKLRKENGVRLNNSKDQLRAAPLEKFGSFFGPSKPVIADRVIQESRSLLETQHLAAKASTSQSDLKKAPLSSSSGTKNGVINKPPPPPVKSKAQIIKATRDYSFLLSDDAEPPKSSKDPGPSKKLVPKPGSVFADLEDARSAQVPTKSSHPSSQAGGKRINGHEQRNGHDPRKQSSGVAHSRPQNLAPQKLNSSNNKGSLSSDSRKQVDLRKQPQPNKHLGTSNGNGPARPTGPIKPAAARVLPPKRPLPPSERRASVASVEKRLPVGSTERKLPGASSGNKTPAASKNSSVNGQRMPIAKSPASASNNRLEQKSNIQRNNEGKILKKVNAADPRNQLVRPQKQDPYRASSQKDAYIKKPKPAGQSSLQRPGPSSKEQYNKKRRAEDAFSDEEGFDFRSEIRKMFGARIAKKEDDEELIKIMEEERQERLRKQAKLRKMSQRR
ncbi:hypothetical protein Cgig2_014303 [Carnegiea gigantea]|uniref:Protein SPT2 homolog n=1 Tax=Carnegiea gigantea TaxID=171969 RepID=A0A9Q1JW64_9CARY|nr:hypothetical protein Cgig2_014303 [Carnegiea gigantea]